MFNTRNLIIAALSIALIYFLCFGLQDLIFSSAFITRDSDSYMHAADMLYKNGEPHAMRPLGFALILGLPNLLFKTVTQEHYVVFGVCMNLLCWIGSVVFLFKSLKLFFLPRISFLIASVSILCIGSLAQVFFVLTESVTSFGLSIIAFNLLLYSKNNNLKHLIISCSLMNVLILIRPGFFYLGVLFSLVLIAFLLYRRYKSMVMYLVFGVSVLSVCAQIVMMHRTYGIASVSFIDKVTWYYYLGAETEAKLSGSYYMDIYHQRHEYLGKKTYKEIVSECSADMKDALKQHPTIVLKEYGKNLIENSYGGSFAISALSYNESKGDFRQSITKALFNFSRLQNVFFIGLFVVSLYLMIGKRLNLGLVLLTAIIGYVILTSGISFWQGDRFHFILYPSIILLFMAQLSKRPIADNWVRNNQ